MNERGWSTVRLKVLGGLRHRFQLLREGRRWIHGARPGANLSFSLLLFLTHTSLQLPQAGGGARSRDVAGRSRGVQPSGEGDGAAQTHGHHWRKAPEKGRQRGAMGAEGTGPAKALRPFLQAGDTPKQLWLCTRVSPDGVGGETAPYSETRYEAKQKLDMNKEQLCKPRRDSSPSTLVGATRAPRYNRKVPEMRLSLGSPAAVEASVLPTPLRPPSLRRVPPHKVCAGGQRETSRSSCPPSPPPSREGPSHAGAAPASTETCHAWTPSHRRGGLAKPVPTEPKPGGWAVSTPASQGTLPPRTARQNMSRAPSDRERAEGPSAGKWSFLARSEPRDRHQNLRTTENSVNWLFEMLTAETEGKRADGQPCREPGDTGG